MYDARGTLRVKKLQTCPSSNELVSSCMQTLTRIHVFKHDDLFFHNPLPKSIFMFSHEELKEAGEIHRIQLFTELEARVPFRWENQVVMGNNLSLHSRQFQGASSSSPVLIHEVYLQKFHRIS